MKNNLDHFSELVEHSKAIAADKDEYLQKNDDLYIKLTLDMTKEGVSAYIAKALPYYFLKIS